MSSEAMIRLVQPTIYEQCERLAARLRQRCARRLHALWLGVPALHHHPLTNQWRMLSLLLPCQAARVLTLSLPGGALLLL